MDQFSVDGTTMFCLYHFHGLSLVSLSSVSFVLVSRHSLVSMDNHSVITAVQYFVLLHALKQV